MASYGMQEGSALREKVSEKTCPLMEAGGNSTCYGWMKNSALHQLYMDLEPEFMVFAESK